MKEFKLEEGETIFKEVDPLFPDKLEKCSSCGRLVKKETWRFIAKLGRALCPVCMKSVCDQCNYIMGKSLEE